MTCNDLPPELWIYIFGLATDEAILSDRFVPTAWSESVWFRTVFKEWTLRSPQESISDIQRRSYTTKKVIVSTCRVWRRIGAEYLFKYIHVERPSQLRLLCSILDKDSSLGWWTKRLYLVRFLPGGREEGYENAAISSAEDCLISVIRHLPNLEVFGVKWPMGKSFGPVADALCTFCPSVCSLQWTVLRTSLSRVIWSLPAYPHLTSLYIDFQPSTTSLRLGSAADLSLTLPHVSQLSLHNCFTDFVDQAAGWSMPSLTSLTLDFGINVDTLPDIPNFLTSHGHNLTYLDLNLVPPLDIPTVLSLCPLLRTFCFNPDWPLNASQTDPLTGVLVHKPHQNITHVGLHQLLHAFGVGYVSTVAPRSPLRAHLIQRANDMAVSALNKRNFPSLQCVRILNRGLLSDLERANGPDESCLERWERWWSSCARQGVRLEDCTGAVFGTLPPAEEEEEEDDDSETTMSGESEEYRDGENQSTNIPELRQLLHECRMMTATRAPVRRIV